LSEILIRNRMLAGALAGYCSWIIYGIVELSTLQFTAWIVMPRHDLRPLQIGMTIALFFGYGLIGALSGAILALCLPLAQALRACTSLIVSALTLVYVYAAMDAWTRGEHRAVLLAVGITGLLIMSCIAIRDNAVGRLLRPFSNPWGACMLGVIPGWIANRLGWVAQLRNLGIVVAIVAVIVAIMFGFQRRRKSEAFTLRSALGLSAIAVLLVVAGMVYTPTPLLTAYKQTQPPPNAPNIILIVLDTVRADHMSLYGYDRDTTPGLRAFAKDSIVFLNSYSAGDFTLPSHASMFTGIYPARHGAHEHLGSALSPNATVLAEILQSKGYSTAAIASNHAYLTAHYGLGQGFEYFDSRARPSATKTYRDCPSLREGIAGWLDRHPSDRNLTLMYRDAEEITRLGMDRLQEFSKQRRPFFLLLNYMDAHSPRLPPQPFRDLYPGRNPLDAMKRDLELKEQVSYLGRPLPEVDRAHVVSQYDGAIAYMDSQLSVLIGDLRKSGVLDNTILAITSDHGESIGDHGFFDHAMSVYQEQIRVPLLLRVPGVSHRDPISVPVSGVDLLPTLLESAGLEAPQGLDGNNLLKELPDSRVVYAESYPNPSKLGANRLARIERAAITRQWKLIVSTKGKRELYDLVNDPKELHNVADSHPEMVAALEPGLAKLSMAAKAQPSTRSSDPEALRKLKSLGYAGGQ